MGLAAPELELPLNISPIPSKRKTTRLRHEFDASVSSSVPKKGRLMRWMVILTTRNYLLILPDTKRKLHIPAWAG
jgi:hypothetical protein